MAKGRLALPSDLVHDRIRRQLGAAAPPAEAPLVLIGRDGRRRVVLAADRAAHAAGLRVGMPVTKAQALTPGLIVKDADPAARREKRSNASPSGRCKHYAPMSPPTSTTDRHRRHWARRIFMARRRHAAGDGRAGSPPPASPPAPPSPAAGGAAHALARFAARPAIVIPPGQERESDPGSAIRRLPPAEGYGRRPSRPRFEIVSELRPRLARRSPCASVPNLAAASIRPWDGSVSRSIRCDRRTLLRFDASLLNDRGG